MALTATLALTLILLQSSLSPAASSSSSSTPTSRSNQAPTNPWSALLPHDQFWKQQKLLWRSLRKDWAPSVGSLFVGSMKMPVIGRQTFMLRIISRTRAQIILAGALNLDEPATYSMGDDGSGWVDIVFNEATLDLLRRWRTTIRAVTYRHEDDTCQLVIAPPVIPAIRVRLRRKSDA